MNSRIIKATIASASGVTFLALASISHALLINIDTGNFGDRPLEQNPEPVSDGSLWAIVGIGDVGAMSWQAYGPETSWVQNSPILDAGGDPTGDMFSGRVQESSQGGPATGFAPATFTDIAVDHTSRPNGIASTGGQFGIIWFPGITDVSQITAGTTYGFYTNSNLVFDDPGSAVNYRDHITNDMKGAEYTVVPEPSTYAAIFGFGVLLFVFLRRRFKK